MTYDAKLAARIRRVLPPTDHIVEQHMFGGLVFGRYMGPPSLRVRRGATAAQTATAPTASSRFYASHSMTTVLPAAA